VVGFSLGLLKYNVLEVHENQDISAHGTISNINAFTYFSIS